MRIQHNILAMNAYRNYNTNTSALGKNLEKLSSGYKINRAGDDAAGLAISEKMRAQITGLNAAQKNVKDGISLVKTAEGAMQEIQDMLNRMDYLATQSANGTYDNEVDRANLQKEVNALKTEINRIADSANFNGIKLMDGSLDSTITSETVANYTDGKNNVPILQESSDDPFNDVGTKTILHKDGVKTAQKVHFEVELHNTEIVGAHGDTVTVSIGDKNLTLKFDRDATSSTATAGVLKEGKVSAEELATAIKNAWESTDQLINGQKVTVVASKGKLTFEQAANPSHSGEEVEACKGIQITHGGSSVKSKTEVYLTEAEQKALTTSKKIIIGGKEYNLGTFAATATGVSTSDGTYKVQYDNGKLTVINQTGAAAVTGVKIGSAAANAANPTVSANGSAAAAATCGNVTPFSGAVSSAKITFVDGDGKAVSGGTFTVSGSGAVSKGSFTVDGVQYNFTCNTTTGAFSLTAATKGADGNKVFGYTVETSVSTGGAMVTAVVSGGAINMAGGADEKGATAKYDMSGVSAGTTIEFNGMKFTVGDDLKATLRDIADAVNGATAYQGLYNVTVDGNNLVVESKVTTTGSDVKDTVSIKTGGVEETALELDAVNQPSSGSGSWNIQTTNNRDGKAVGGDQLASTTFQLNSGIVRDGNVLTIGKDTYTFKVGKDSTVAAEGNSKLIDLSSLEEGDSELIDLAGKLLTQAGNSAFTIGYDKKNPGVVSIHEIKGQTDYTNGELGTVDSFDKLVSFISIGDQSVSEETSAGGKALTLQIGDTSDSFNQMQLSIGDMHTKAMGTGKYTDEDGNEVKVTKTIEDIDISNQEGAAEAVRVIKNAINYVSSIRGDLGATQNRLEHTANNLSVMAENIQDAESTIRDTDVAEEMMAYTKNNILVQSAQAMLAQANAVPQGVLQLLG